MNSFNALLLAASLLTATYFYVSKSMGILAQSIIVIKRVNRWDARYRALKVAVSVCHVSSSSLNTFLHHIKVF